MRHISMIVVLAVMVGVAAGTVAAQENKYSGTKICATCHKQEKVGAASLIWEKSAHAKAYQTLLSEEAKKIARAKGLKTPPHESEACLKCHVTGGGTAKNVEKSFDMKEGVTCEACHGAASAYKIVHSRDAAKGKAAGLIKGDSTGKQCLTCHNEESPTYKPFDFKKEWAKIAHPDPSRTKK
jgi:hypothetical protein